MGKSIIIVSILFFTVTAYAQNLTETEVLEIMNKALMLNEAEKYTEALDAFLLVGQNTEKQRTEEERQMYVYSQMMALMCYGVIDKYEDGYLLSKKLLQGKLTDEEKKNVISQYVFNGYMMAASYMHGDDRRFGKARELFAELLPYADEDMRQRILPKVPLT